MSMLAVLWNAELEKAQAKGKKKPAEDPMHAAVAAGIKSAQEVNAKNHPEDNWRVELDELQRRLQGLPSVAEAERALASLEAAVAEQARGYESRIKAAYDAASTPFLTRHEQSEAGRRVEALSGVLEDLHRNTRVKLAQAKALVETAKTWNPLRARFQELSARKAAVDKALSSR